MRWNSEGRRKAERVMGIGGSLFALLFIIAWCVVAASTGVWFMVLFGVLMAGLMTWRLIVCIRMTKEEPRQETDPWECQVEAFDETAAGCCPYCGGAVEAGFVFCPKCGRKLG